MKNNELKKEGSLKLADFMLNRRIELGMTIEEMSSDCNMPVMMYKLFEDGYRKIEDLSNSPFITDIAKGMRVLPDKIRVLVGKTYY